MTFSVIVLGGDDPRGIIDILKKLPDVANIKIFSKLTRLHIKDPYILILPRIRAVDKIVTRVVDLLTTIFSRGSEYDILIFPVKLLHVEVDKDRKLNIKVVLERLTRGVKLFLAKLASSVSRVLVPEITCSAFDLIVIRGNLLKSGNGSLRSLSNLLASILQRAVYSSEYRIYVSKLPIEINLNEFDMPMQDIIKYVHILFSSSDYRVLKFMCVGLSGVIVNVLMLHLMYGILSLPLFVSGFVAIESSIINNFVWNSIWTFKLKVKKSSLRETMLRLLKYHVAVSAGALVNYTLLLLLTLCLGVNHVVSNIIGIGLGALANYLLSDRFVWKLCRG